MKDAAQHLYSHVALPGPLERLWWMITQHYPEPLLSLSTVCGLCELKDRHYVGMRVVPMDEIQGSEERAQDYDRDFRPMRNYNRQRWLRVALQRLRGMDPPPVVLIRVGEVYFVRDGHYRVSVSRALGTQAIRAEVIEWDVTCERPLPWDAESAEGAG